MQNFGKIKNTLNDIFAEGIITKNDSSKVLFKKYLKLIRESEVLKTQFMVFNNIENRIDSDPHSINLFISENVKLFEKFNTKQIEKENKKLLDLIPDGKLNESYELAALHESISNLILTKRTPQSVDKITGEIKNITNYISSNKARQINERIDLPPSMLTTLFVEKYNREYDTLDEYEREGIKVLMGSDFEAKKSFYEKTVNECIQLVDSSIKTADGEAKEKLTKVKDKLLSDGSKVLQEEHFETEVFKLIDLRYNLLGE
jgi:hypothetical protein